MSSNVFADSVDTCYSRAITSVVSAILSNAGFSNCDPKLISVLNEMLQSLLIETGRLSKALAEHSGRTQPLLSDVQLALIEMGIDIVSIPEFAAKETNRIILLPPLQQTRPSEIKTLKSGPKQQLSYIPDYFPELPDTRTYINTPVQRKDKDDFKLVRERDASEKRNLEKAYTKYLARTNQTYSFFDNKDAFPLIANNPNPNMPSYIPALLGKYSFGPFEKLNTALNNNMDTPASTNRDPTIASSSTSARPDISNSEPETQGADKRISNVSEEGDVINEAPSEFQTSPPLGVGGDTLSQDNPYVRFLERRIT